jgi:hypothetical protein
MTGDVNALGWLLTIPRGIVLIAVVWRTYRETWVVDRAAE